MTDLQGAILGIIQGLTEFLPISSSGHLVIAQILFGLKEAPLLYDVFLHLATLIAMFVVFWPQIRALFSGLLRLPKFFRSWFQKGHLAIADDPQAWGVILIFLTTAVTGTIGVVFEKQFEETFNSVYWLSPTFALTGFLLFFTRNRSQQTGKGWAQATLGDALFIGLLQGLSILPALSRSGATIAAALYCGFDRRLAGEYSFLVAIPAIAGAVVLESRKGFSNLGVSPLGAGIGFFFSLVLGILTLKLLLGWIRGGKLTYFAYYCWLIALFTLFLAFRS